MPKVERPQDDVWKLYVRSKNELGQVVGTCKECGAIIVGLTYRCDSMLLRSYYVCRYRLRRHAHGCSGAPLLKCTPNERCRQARLKMGQKPLVTKEEPGLMVARAFFSTGMSFTAAENPHFVKLMHCAFPGSPPPFPSLDVSSPLLHGLHCLAAACWLGHCWIKFMIKGGRC